LKKQVEKVLREVFSNHEPKRFTPRSLTGGTGWGVWDGKANRFVADKDLLKIDASEILVN